MLDGCTRRDRGRGRGGRGRHPRLRLHALHGPGEGVGARAPARHGPRRRQLLGRRSRPRPPRLDGRRHVVAAGLARARSSTLVAAGADAIGGVDRARRRPRTTLRRGAAPPARAALAGARCRAREPGRRAPPLQRRRRSASPPSAYATRRRHRAAGRARGRGVRARGSSARGVADRRAPPRSGSALAPRRRARAPRGLAATSTLDALARRAATTARRGFALDGCSSASTRPCRRSCPRGSARRTIGRDARPRPARFAGRRRRRGPRRRRRLRRRHRGPRPRRRRGRRSRRTSCCRSYGPARGKGDAMWRALAATAGDVLAFLDADSADSTRATSRACSGRCSPTTELALVKGAFRRPLPRPAGRSSRTEAAGSPSSWPARC